MHEQVAETGAQQLDATASELRELVASVRQEGQAGLEAATAALQVCANVLVCVFCVCVHVCGGEDCWCKYCAGQ